MNEERIAGNNESTQKNSGKFEEAQLVASKALPTAVMRRDKEKKVEEPIDMIEEKIPNYDESTRRNTSSKGRGTTRSGRPIAGPGNKLSSARLTKTVRHESANPDGNKEARKPKTRSPDLDRKQYKEDEVENLSKQMDEAGLDKKSELRQTSKKVLKKISKELIKYYGMDKDVAWMNAIRIEQKVQESLFSDPEVKDDDELILKYYKEKIVSLIKAIEVLKVSHSKRRLNSCLLVEEKKSWWMPGS